MNEANMRAAFNLFDKDGGGTIEADEVAKILGANAAADDSVWQAVIKEVDINNDGQIDFEEFRTMLLKLADRKSDEEAVVSPRVSSQVAAQH